MSLVKPKVRQHTRCALCGRGVLLPSGEVLPKSIKASHDLEVQLQTIAGPGKMQWSTRPMDEDELRELQRVVEALAKRLAEKFGRSCEARLEEANAKIAALEISLDWLHEREKRR